MDLWPRSPQALGTTASGRRAGLMPMTVGQAENLADQLAAINPWSTLGTSINGLVQAMGPGSQEHAKSWCLTVDGEPAGAMVIRDGWLKGPFLTLFAVIPHYQRQGLARAAMEWWEVDARRSRASNLWLSVSDFNIAAQQFYHKTGFTQVAAIDDLVVDGRSEILMRKRLTGAHSSGAATKT